MSQNKYARELEKAVFNWYYCGKDKDITPLFNVIRTGMDNDMRSCLYPGTKRSRQTTHRMMMSRLLKISAMLQRMKTVITTYRYSHLQQKQKMEQNFVLKDIRWI